MKFFIFVCVPVTRLVKVTLQSSCDSFKIEDISGSTSKSYFILACHLILRSCVSFRGLYICIFYLMKNYENHITVDDVTFLEFRLIYSFICLLFWHEDATSTSSFILSSQSCHWVLLKSMVSYQHLSCFMALKSSFFPRNMRLPK